MYNLAVLYAEGLEGKPEYETSAKRLKGRPAWRRRQPVQSRRPLCPRHRRHREPCRILQVVRTGRRGGDRAAGKKRDELAAHMDAATLAAASPRGRDLQGRAAAGGRDHGRRAARRLGQGCGAGQAAAYRRDVHDREKVNRKMIVQKRDRGVQAAKMFVCICCWVPLWGPAAANLYAV